MPCEPEATRARQLEALYGPPPADGAPTAASAGAGPTPPDPHAAAHLAHSEAARRRQTTAPAAPPRPRHLHVFVVGLAVGALVVAVAAALGLRAGSPPSAAPDPSPEAAALIGATTPIGRLLLRDARPGDLPLGFQGGSVGPFPGSSYRLLFDALPAAASSTARWRVWVGTGTDESQLCVVAAFDASRSTTECYPRRQLFAGAFTITSPTGVTPITVELDHGSARVDGRAIAPPR